jgi:hypothetical protein
MKLQTLDYLGQVTKDNQSQKIPHGMYPCNCISLVTTRIFHPLTSCRTMRLQIQLHKILGSIFKKLNLNDLIF